MRGPREPCAKRVEKPRSPLRNTPARSASSAPRHPPGFRGEQGGGGDGHGARPHHHTLPGFHAPAPPERGGLGGHGGRAGPGDVHLEHRTV